MSHLADAAVTTQRRRRARGRPGRPDRATRRGRGRDHRRPAAALSALHEWAGGRSIETLAGGLRLSHSRTVRVVDRLAADGLARRARDPGDGRTVLVELTPAGRRRRGGARARAGALEASLWRLAPGERGAFAALAETLLGGATTGRRAAGAICRLCDAHACGHDEGRCPVTRAADRADERAAAAAGTLEPAPPVSPVAGGSVAVVVPDERLHVMSEQAARPARRPRRSGIRAGRPRARSTRIRNGSWAYANRSSGRMCRFTSIQVHNVLLRSRHCRRRRRSGRSRQPRARRATPRPAPGAGTEAERERALGHARAARARRCRPSRRRAARTAKPGHRREARGGAARGRARARRPCS